MNNAGNDYLEMEVLTAIPQKLQLLLIEGALRFGNQAKQHWKNGNDQAANEALIRTQEIVSEILGNFNPQENPKLARDIIEVYAFIYRNLIQANLERNETKLNDALRVLQIERETWRLACQQASAMKASLAPGDDNMASLGQSFIA